MKDQIFLKNKVVFEFEFEVCRNIIGGELRGTDLPALKTDLGIDGLQRLRNNRSFAGPARRQVRIITNGEAMAEALSNPDESIDAVLVLCGNSLARQGLKAAGQSAGDSGGGGADCRVAGKRVGLYAGLGF